MKYGSLKHITLAIVVITAIIVFIGCSKSSSPNIAPVVTPPVKSVKISLVASGFNMPNYIAVDATGNLYITQYPNSLILKVNTSGIVSTLAGDGKMISIDGVGASASFDGPNGITVDDFGNIYVVDTGGDSMGLIRKISSGDVVTSFAGGNVDQSHGFADNGQGSQASFYGPTGIAADANGNLYVADTQNNLIRKITPDSIVTTFAGKYGTYSAINGIGTAASFWGPNGVAVDVSGNVYVADTGNELIRKITPAGVVTTLAGSGTNATSDGKGTAASFSAPIGIAVDASGNVYVSEWGSGAIRKITPSGVVSTYVPKNNFKQPTGLAIDSSNNLYVVDTQVGEVFKVYQQ